MDAFYASVEQRDFPELRGKAIAVGGGGRRGVVATASYEARKYGVHSAMPGFMAKQKCRDLIFVKPRYEAYKEASQQIRTIFQTYTDLIEPLSLDEAYLDVTENKKNEPLATELAKKIRTEIFEQTQLTCSAGISYCKFLAKIASDYKKPNGQTVIKPHKAEVFIEQLSIKKFYGIGKVTAQKMEAMGINTGYDLKQLSEVEMVQNFGKMGRFYFNIVRGIDDRPVRTERIRKSLGVERTLNENLTELSDIIEQLKVLLGKFYERLQKANNYGRTLTLKLKTADFQIITRSTSKNYYLKDIAEIEQLALQLLHENAGDFEAIRLIGISTSNLEKKAEAEGKAKQLRLDF